MSRLSTARCILSFDVSRSRDPACRRACPRARYCNAAKLQETDVCITERLAAPFHGHGSGVASRQRKRPGAVREGSMRAGSRSRHKTADCQSLRSRFEPDGQRQPRVFPQSRRLPVGLPGPYPSPGIHPADRRRSLRRRLHDQLGVECLSRHLGTDVRSSVRARVPSRPRRRGLARAP